MSFLHPSTSIDSLEIIPGQRIADFGCGSGHWAAALSRAVGPGGKVFAIDIQEPALEATRALMRSLHLQNIETIRADVETPSATALKDATLDAVLISNMLFQADQKANVAKEAARILKPGGRVFLIDWDSTNSPSSMGPPLRQRMSRTAVQELFEAVGMHYIKEFNTGSYHYGLIFRK
ncbi:MAG: methylase involved in ubiquinone/menaquinone biosynthesi [Parcubacteria group bacterium Gr01-1014_70]|nr:MAG: methylase involved in ubiquinone/menaquinone biosynthesi [Parcubacteria group bacterium Gr01-1014_70]